MVWSSMFVNSVTVVFHFWITQEMKFHQTRCLPKPMYVEKKQLMILRQHQEGSCTNQYEQ